MSDSDEIVVVWRGGKTKPEPHPTLVIPYETGTGGSANVLWNFFDSLFRDVTKYYVSPDFSETERAIIIQAVKGLENDPRFKDRFNAIKAQNLAINVRPPTRPEHVGEDSGRTFGKNDDGTFDNGATVNVYVKVTNASPLTFAVRVIHELLHTLGDHVLDTTLDAPGSTFDRSVALDVFRGYNFSSAGSSAAIGLADVIGAPNGGGAANGSNGGSVIVGSDSSDTLTGVGGGNLFYPRGGSNEVIVISGTEVDTIVSEGGDLTISLPSTVSSNDVTLLTSSDGSFSILAAGRPIISVEEKGASMTHVSLKIGGLTFAASSFPSAASSVQTSYSLNIDYHGPFYGGLLGSVFAATGNSSLVYRLASVNGDYSDQPWSVHMTNGNINADFTKPDLQGSQFTFLSVVASDGVTATAIDVTIRWAYSNEETPQL